MDVVVVDSAQVDVTTRNELRSLWDRAFGDRFTDTDDDHAYGGVHVVVRDGERVIGHASVIPRRIRFGDQPWRTVGYVEAVAVDPERQGEGIGRRMMQLLRVEIASRFAIALLSTGRAARFYESLGWERWLGLAYTRTSDGVVPNGRQSGLMILRLDRSVVPDVSVAVTCEDRPGRTW